MSLEKMRAARAPAAARAADALTPTRSDFYREEFIKHKQCLERQREYYSERVICDVEAAIQRILAELDQLCATQDADVVVSRLLRKIDVLTGLSAWSDPKKAH
jgi:hypothetical protein